MQVNDRVKCLCSVGVIRRILSDSDGQLAMVQMLGKSIYNLKPVPTNEIESYSSNFVTLAETARLLKMTIRELKSSSIDMDNFLIELETRIKKCFEEFGYDY